MGVLDTVRQLPARARAIAQRMLPAKRGELKLIGTVPGSGGPMPAHGQTRASAVGKLIALMTGGKHVPQRSIVHYEVNAREGYERNPIVYRCIRLVAEALKAMPLVAYSVNAGGEETELPATHPLRVVLDSPNPRQSWGDLVDEIVGHLYLAGETFLEGVTLSKTALRDAGLAEIYALRPDRMAVIPDEFGDVGAYQFEGATGQKRFEVPARGFSPILHIRQWNPRDHWRGLPTVAPAAAPADEYSEAVQQNRSLLNNAAMPSGALVYSPKEGQGSMTDEQFERVKAEMAEEYSGPKNAGKPMVIDNLDWKPFGMTPRDAMAVEQRNQAAREAALALGVPPLVLGLPGDNTFANYEEANLAFYRQTVAPLAAFLGEKVSRWIRPLAGPGVRVCFDLDQSPLGEAERAVKWERVKGADMLTVDEKREALGYEPLPDGKGEHVLIASGLSTLDDVILGEPDPEEAAAAAYGTEPEDDDGREE